MRDKQDDAGIHKPAPDGPPPSVGNIPDLAFWEWNLDTGTAEYSPEWRGLLGLADGHPLGTDIAWWHNRMPEEDLERLLQACLDSLADGGSINVAVRTSRSDGGAARLVVRGVVLAGADGAGRKIAGYAAARSPAMNLESEAHTGESPYSAYAMMDNAPDVFIRFNRDLVIIYLNKAAGRYIAVPPLKNGEHYVYAELGHSPERECFYRTNVARVFATGRVVRETVVLPFLPGRITCEFHFWPELAPDGTVASVMCQMLDRSEQARTKAEKRLSEDRLIAMNRLTQMQDDSEQAIIDFVLEQMALMTQSEYSHLFFPGEEKDRGVLHVRKSLRGSAHERAPRSDRHPRLYLPHRAGPEEEITRTYVGNKKSDGHSYLEFSGCKLLSFMAVPAKENGRTVCVATVGNKPADYDRADVRQLELFINGVWLVLRRKRYLRTLEKAKEDAEAANRAKDEFLANVSHELRTPLNGMLSMLQLLQLSGLSEEQAQYVENADLSGKALLRILSDILDFSRMESGKMALHPGRFDLRATLTSTISLFADEARRKGLGVSLDIDERIPSALMGDDARVRQIIFNLAGNALKFTEQGGIGMECSLLPGSPKNHIRIYLAVTDTGIGMPPAAHDAIFDAFTQLDGSNTRKYAGTGLGLGIVKRLVLAMNGSLAVESAPGEGTTIHVSLLFARAEAAEPAGMRQNRPEEKTAGRIDGRERLSILVAEDDPVSRFAIRAFLQKAGHLAVCVDNGRQALEALCVYPFDCLFSDIQMPVMDGLEAARRIRQNDLKDIMSGPEALAVIHASIPEADLNRRVSVPTDLPLVALTAHAMTGNREHFLRMGMDLYLSKPVITEELRIILEKLLQRKR